MSRAGGQAEAPYAELERDAGFEKKPDAFTTANLPVAFAEKK